MSASYTGLYRVFFQKRNDSHQEKRFVDSGYEKISNPMKKKQNPHPKLPPAKISTF
jgi:hypothetical protein